MSIQAPLPIRISILSGLALVWLLSASCTTNNDDPAPWGPTSSGGSGGSGGSGIWFATGGAAGARPTCNEFDLREVWIRPNSNEGGSAGHGGESTGQGGDQGNSNTVSMCHCDGTSDEYSPPVRVPDVDKKRSCLARPEGMFGCYDRWCKVETEVCFVVLSHAVGFYYGATCLEDCEDDTFECNVCKNQGCGQDPLTRGRYSGASDF